MDFSHSHFNTSFPSSTTPNESTFHLLQIRAAWGGVDAEHPFELLSNPEELPPLFISIFAFILFGFFILSNLPGLLIRCISNKRIGEIFKGIKLSSRSPSSPSFNNPFQENESRIALAQTPTTPFSRSRNSTFQTLNEIGGPGGSEFASSSKVQLGADQVGSPTYPSPTYQTPTTATSLRSFNTYPSPSREKLIRKTNPPKHLLAIDSILPFTHWLGIRIPIVGYTLGQVIVCAIWGGLTALGLFYKADVVLDTVRSGFVATNQLPICFLLAGKVNWIGYLVGKGYEKINFLHRFVGRMIFVGATFHAGSYLAKWLKKGGITYVSEASQKPFIMAGIVAWSAFAFIGLTSIPIIRRRMYGLFWISHWIGFVTAIIALSFHKPYTGVFATICLLLYTKDVILRLLLKTRIVPARIIALSAPSLDPSAGSIKIVLPLRSGWRAGQHVFIRIPALNEMGGMAWLENHPFTIGSAEGNDLVLIAKKSGGWTRDLYDFASRGGIAPNASRISTTSRYEKNSNEGEGADDMMEKIDFSTSEKEDVIDLEEAQQVLGRNCKVLVEGPYGGPCSTVFSSYSGILLIAGGSGVTYSLSMFEDLIKKAEEGHVRATTVHFVWIVKTYEDTLPILSTLEDLHHRAYYTTFTPKITVFISRSAGSVSTTRGNIKFISERPDLSVVVRESVYQTRSDNLSAGAGNCGLLISVCGPRRLIDGTNMAVRSVSWKERKDIGGVTVHNETFGW